MGNLSKWLCQQDAHRLSVLGAGLNAAICFFPTWNLGEFLEFANLGLNVNRKDLDCEVQNLETKSVLGTCANFAKCLSVAESSSLNVFQFIGF